MEIMQAFIRRHSLSIYFVLTFAISWGGIVIVLGPGGLPMAAEQFEAVAPLVYLALLLGPSVGGIVMTGLVDGKAGYRRLLSRLLRWRVGARWYAVALLTVPLLATAVLLALSILSSEFVPVIFTSDDKATLLLAGIALGLVIGFFEELGCTGFAVPKLRLCHGVLATGLIVGLLWGAWHFVLFWESGSFANTLSLVLLLALLFSWLPAYRVLMVWVYDRTESLSVAILMHASLATSQFILIPMTLAGMALLTWLLVWAAVLWLVVAAVAVANHGHLSRQGKPPASIGSPQLTPR